MVIYDIEPIPPVVVEVCRNIVASSKSLQLAFEALNSNQKIIADQPNQ